MRSRRAAWLRKALAALLLFTLPSASALAGPSPDISDGAHGGNPHFFFLPPLVPEASPRPSGTFNASLSPVVRIDELGAADTGLAVATFTTGGAGSERVRVNAEDEYYIVNWHTKRFALDPSKTYRIRVLVAGTQLGFADVDLVRSATELKGVDPSRFVGVVNGQTVPVKFWIGREAVFVVGASGGTITAVGGSVTLTVPAGALSADVGITVEPAQPPGVRDFAAVPGAVFDLGPDGTTFASAVELTIHYDEGLLPAGIVEESLGLFRLEGGSWTRVAGSTVDTAANTVRGAITTFSTYGVVSFLGGVPTLSSFGTATIDGVIGANEWALAARVNFVAAVPGGGTTPATLFVMNDASNLYLAVRFDRSVRDAQNSLTFVFDNNDDGVSANGDDKLQYVADPSLGFLDEHFSTAPPCPALTFCAVDDVTAGGTNDGTGAFQHHGTFSVYELSHPLDTADNAHDFSLGQGKTVGFFLGLSMVDAQNNPFDTFFPGNGIHGHILIQPAPLLVLTGKGTATVDGSLSPGEWDKAACIFFAVSLPGGGGTPAQFCVMNDATTIFVALRFVRSAADPGNSFAVEFDNDNDGVAENGDDVILFNPAVGFVDDVRTNAPPCPAGSAPAACGPQDTAVGGTTDGSGAFKNDGTFSTYEMSHPLDSADNANDFSLVAGDTVGFFVSVRIIGAGNVIVDTDFPGFRQYARIKIAP